MLRAFFSKTVSGFSQRNTFRFFGTAPKAVESTSQSLQKSGEALDQTKYKTLHDLPEDLRLKIDPELLKKYPDVIDPNKIKADLEKSAIIRKNYSAY